MMPDILFTLFALIFLAYVLSLSIYGLIKYNPNRYASLTSRNSSITPEGLLLHQNIYQRPKEGYGEKLIPWGSIIGIIYSQWTRNRIHGTYRILTRSEDTPYLYCISDVYVIRIIGELMSFMKNSRGKELIESEWRFPINKITLQILVAAESDIDDLHIILKNIYDKGKYNNPGIVLCSLVLIYSLIEILLSFTIDTGVIFWRLILSFLFFWWGYFWYEFHVDDAVEKYRLLIKSRKERSMNE